MNPQNGQMIILLLSPGFWIGVLFLLWLLPKVLRWALPSKRKSMPNVDVVITSKRTSKKDSTRAVDIPATTSNVITGNSSDSINVPGTTSNTPVSPEVIKSSTSSKGYNESLMSGLFDFHIQPFLDRGARAIQPGEVLRIFPKGSDPVTATELEEAISDPKKYKKYPFSFSLQRELRTMFLLQTESDDSFEGLWSRLQKASEKFMSPAEFSYLTEAVKKGNERLRYQTYTFPLPVAPTGRVEPASDSYAKELGVSEKPKDFFVERRTDGPDLLALKELVLIAEGKKVHPLSIGPGFFCKYTIELNALGVFGVIFKVKKDKLVEIKLGEFKSKVTPTSEFPGYDVGVRALQDYSPLLATSLLYYSVLGKDVLIDSTNEHGQTRKNRQWKYGEFPLDTKYFVVVDGMVSGPSTKLPMNYEAPSKNDMGIRAGECFLFQADPTTPEELKVKIYPIITRLYFYPHDPSKTSPYFQTGSVSFGVNDMSYHSTVRKPHVKGADPINEESYKRYMKEQYDKGEKCEFADIASMLHYFPRPSNGSSSFSTVTDVFRKENNMALAHVIDAIVEHNYFTFLNCAQWVMLANIAFFTPMVTLQKWGKKSYPLHYRWNVSQYLKDGCGITLEPQPTFYTTLRDRWEDEDFRRMLAFNAECAAKRAKGS